MELCFQVESALIEHDAVKESAVVSSPDKDRGSVYEFDYYLTLIINYCQVVKAFIVLTDKYNNVYGNEEKEKFLIEQLQNHVKSTTAPYKYPRKIQFVESLPKTVSGKIRRGELRNMELKD